MSRRGRPKTRILMSSHITNVTQIPYTPFKFHSEDLTNGILRVDNEELGFIFNDYNTDRLPKMTLADCVRVSSAAPGYLPMVLVDNVTPNARNSVIHLADGGVINNNPSLSLLTENLECIASPQRQRRDFELAAYNLISVGTGFKRKDQSLNPVTLDQLSSLAAVTTGPELLLERTSFLYKQHTSVSFKSIRLQVDLNSDTLDSSNENEFTDWMDTTRDYFINPPGGNESNPSKAVQVVAGMFLVKADLLKSQVRLADRLIIDVVVGFMMNLDLQDLNTKDCRKIRLGSKDQEHLCITKDGQLKLVNNDVGEPAVWIVRRSAHDGLDEVWSCSQNDRFYVISVGRVYFWQTDLCTRRNILDLELFRETDGSLTLSTIGNRSCCLRQNDGTLVVTSKPGTRVALVEIPSPAPQPRANTAIPGGNGIPPPHPGPFVPF